MPILRAGMKKPPPGFDAIHAKLDEFDDAMKLAIQEDSTGVVGETRKRPRTAEKARSELAVEAPDVHDGSTAHNAGSALPPLWRVAQINRERTRFVFDACFRQKIISPEVFAYCCEMHFIDGGLARRWRLPGYEHLCCTTCGVPGSAGLAASLASKYALRDRQERKDKVLHGGSADKATCICRVPAAQRRSKSFLACAVCGCRGCCSSDAVRPPQPAAVSKETTQPSGDPSPSSQPPPATPVAGAQKEGDAQRD